MAKQGYHHGNLRQALVEAALVLILNKGPGGFTLSEAAKQVGVTPAAVYRHFSGREELLIETACQGHDILARRLQDTCEAGHPDQTQAFLTSCQAYLGFAADFPGHYIAMFESGLINSKTPKLADAAQRTRTILEQAANTLVAGLPAEQRPEATMICAHVWALSHGVIELFARGRSPLHPGAPEDLLDQGLRLYLRGLGL